MPTTQVKQVYQFDPTVTNLIGTSGCSLCSAMSAAYNWDRTVTIQYFAQNNWTPGVGLKDWNNIKCNGGKSMKVAFGAASYSNLKTQLDRNLPAIIKLTGGGTHYVCAYNYTGSCSKASEVMVMDPAMSAGWTTLDKAMSSRPTFSNVGICTYFT